MAEEIIEKINNQIDANKEILSVLPKNNKKNLQAYKEKAAEIKAEYEKYSEDILSEIKRRAIKINSIIPDPKIANTEQEIKYMEKIKLLDKNITSFEKMELDEILYVLKRFYKNNLELINGAIVKCLEKFKIVGVTLTARDFDYSIYTKEYMDVLFSEIKKGDMNSTLVKDTFEQVYWRCPDIITHIELNIRSLYLKNEKIINKYYEDVARQVMDELNANEREALEKYNEKQSHLIDLKNEDTALIIEKFKNGEEAIRDYERENVKKSYKKLLNIDIDEISNSELEEFNKNIIRLNSNLYEYKSYLEFKFIYDELLEIYNTKEKYNAVCSEKLKQIKKLEMDISKQNKKTEKLERHASFILKLFSRGNNNKLERINTNINSKIVDLKNLYREYEENKVKDIISTKLNNDSTIYDGLMLVKNFYSFLADVIIKKYEDILQDEIKTKIANFKQFVEFPNIIIINNIKITEDKDMAIVVKDKYNLCNINITVGDLSEENIDNLIATVNNICLYSYINKSKVTVEDIKFILQANKILEANKNI